jgi:hypothetical protein
MALLSSSIKEFAKGGETIAKSSNKPMVNKQRRQQQTEKEGRFGLKNRRIVEIGSTEF